MGSLRAGAAARSGVRYSAAMPLEFRHMRHVLALAEHGSFARAAAVLGLSQPALTRSIQAAERETGSQLFLRSPGGVEPTDGGRVYIARIRQIVHLTDDLDRDLVSDRGLHSGTLNIGGGPFPAQSMLADALARFVADYPRIIVRVMMRDWDDLLRRLRAREIEYFVSEFSTFEGESDIDVEPLEPHPTFILARREHPLAGRGVVGLADSFNYPYASLSRIPPRTLEPIRKVQRRLPDAAGAQRVFPAIEFHSLDAVRKIVLGSDTLMVAPLACVADDLEGGRLVVLGAEPFITVHYGIVKLRNHALTTVGARFREYALAAERALGERERKSLARWRPTARAPATADVRARRRPRHRS